MLPFFVEILIYMHVYYVIFLFPGLVLKISWVVFSSYYFLQVITLNFKVLVVTTMMCGLLPGVVGFYIPSSHFLMTTGMLDILRYSHLLK
jgi:hypothetical protein